MVEGEGKRKRREIKKSNGAERDQSTLYACMKMSR
jgi:hypothetical protein